MSAKILRYAYLALPVLLIIVFTIFSVVRLRSTARWPIPDKLLRAPGESLRRKLVQLDDNALFHLLGVIFVWSCSLYAMFRLQLALAPNSSFAFITILVTGVVIAAAGAWWFNRFMSIRANYALGFFGERTVGEIINQLMLDGCRIFHDFPADPKWNIDHIIVAPSGVYVVETKTRRKRKAQKGKPDHVINFDGDVLIFPHDEQSRYGLDQARANAKWLSGYLGGATGEKVWVEPILTFPGWLINRNTPSTSVQVLNPKEIRDFVLSRPTRLTAQGIDRIVHQLDQKCRDVEC